MITPARTVSIRAARFAQFGGWDAKRDGFIVHAPAERARHCHSTERATTDQ
jgi:hypothetical protein